MLKRDTKIHLVNLANDVRCGHRKCRKIVSEIERLDKNGNWMRHEMSPVFLLAEDAECGHRVCKELIGKLRQLLGTSRRSHRAAMTRIYGSIPNSSAR
jgi:hypothetical protein